MNQDINRQSPDDQPARWPLFWALVILALAIPALWWYLDPTPRADASSKPVTVVVRPGEGWNDLTDRLHRLGIVRRPLIFKALVVLSGERGHLLPGRYLVKKGTSARDLIATFTDASNQSKITIPEGFRLGQIEDRMLQLGLTTPQQWQEAINNPPKSPLLASKPKGVSIEGYIFPDTYIFTEENAAQQLVREGIANMQKHLSKDIIQGFKRQGLTINEGLTLASIVEREAQVPSERPIIASVYLNRLRKGMPLQADPTVQYAVGRRGEWWKSPLTRQDLKSDSPYNTYVHKGLPPGPICSPGLPSIKAVAYPAHTDYLYFVAKGDGSHAFAKTLQEHEQNIQRYLRR